MHLALADEAQGQVSVTTRSWFVIALGISGGPKLSKFPPPPFFQLQQELWLSDSSIHISSLKAAMMQVWFPWQQTLRGRLCGR